MAPQRKEYAGVKALWLAPPLLLVARVPPRTARAPRHTNHASTPSCTRTHIRPSSIHRSVQALFRTVAMMVPDYALVSHARVVLGAVGGCLQMRLCGSHPQG